MTSLTEASSLYAERKPTISMPAGGVTCSPEEFTNPRCGGQNGKELGKESDIEHNGSSSSGAPLFLFEAASSLRTEFGHLSYGLIIGSVQSSFPTDRSTGYRTCFPLLPPIYLWLAKASMSFSPERRKFRKSTPDDLHVWQTLRRIRSASIPFCDVIPSIRRRSLAKAFIACSALLLFQGMPS